MGWFWLFVRTFVRSFVRSFLSPRAAKPARRWRNGRTHLLSPHRRASVSARTSRFRTPRRHISRRRDDAEPRGRRVAAVRTPNGERTAHPPVRRATDSTRRSIRHGDRLDTAIDAAPAGDAMASSRRARRASSSPRRPIGPCARRRTRSRRRSRCSTASRCARGSPRRPPPSRSTTRRCGIDRR